MDQSPSGQRYALATIVRDLVKASPYRMEDIATELGISTSKVSRMLTGDRAMPLPELQLILRMLGVEDGVLQELVALCRASRRRSPFYDFRDMLLPEELVYLDALSSADIVREHSHLRFPALLMTTEFYAAECELRERGSGPRRAALHRELVSFLDDPHRHFSFVFDETVFLRPPRAQMREQMQHLLVLADRPNIEVRVNPHYNLHAMALHSFSVLSWNGGSPPMYVMPMLDDFHIIRPGQDLLKVGMILRGFDHLANSCTPRDLLPSTVERYQLALAQPGTMTSVVA